MMTLVFCVILQSQQPLIYNSLPHQHEPSKKIKRQRHLCATLVTRATRDNQLRALDPAPHWLVSLSLLKLH